MNTRRCRNCDEDIGLSNFEIHEAFCSRNLKKCDRCNSMVLIKEWDEHISSEHSTVICGLCNMSIEKFSLAEHEVCCPSRLVKCGYCNYELPAHAALEHQERCGCRTELCTICGKYIMIRDFEEHNQLHASSTYSAVAPQDDLMETDFNFALRLQCIELGSQAEEISCNRNNVEQSDDESSSCESETKDQVPCEFCEELFSLSDIVDHQLSCRMNVSFTSQFQSPPSNMSRTLHRSGLCRETSNSVTNVPILPPIRSARSSTYRREFNGHQECSFPEKKNSIESRRNELPPINVPEIYGHRVMTSRSFSRISDCAAQKPLESRPRRPDSSIISSGTFTGSQNAPVVNGQLTSNKIPPAQPKRSFHRE